MAAVGLCLVLTSGSVHAQVPACGATDRRFNPGELPKAPVGSGRVFFVDAAAGNDANDGLAEARAFRSISRAVNGSSAPIAPGDTVRIKAGLYRERLYITKSGTGAGRIMIGAYGNGEVVVDGSDAVTGWTAHSGQIYKAHVNVAPVAVVVDNQPLFPELSLSAVTNGRWYYDAASGTLYLWSPGGGSPASRDVGVVHGVSGEDTIALNPASYLTFYGLTVRFAGDHGMLVLGDYVRVEKCRLRFNNKHGISTFAYGSTNTLGVEIVKNEIYHNVISNWPRGRFKWGGWASGASVKTANALYQGNVVYKNGGEGLVAYLGPGGTVIRDNVVYDNWSVNVYVDNQPNATVSDNFIYCHAPSTQDLYNNGDTDPGDGRNLKRLRPEGIMTADEDYGVTPASNFANATLSNNVIVNCRRGILHYGPAAGSGLKNVNVLNNTVVVAKDPVGVEGPFAGISISYNNGNNTGTIFRNNIVYATLASSYVLYSEDTPVTDNFRGLTLDHNLWFHTTRSNPFHWGPSYQATYDASHAQWVGLPGPAHGGSDVYADPQFLDPAAVDYQSSKKIAATSPAIDKGVAAGLAVDCDFCARPTGPAPDYGAYEYRTTAAPTVRNDFNADGWPDLLFRHQVSGSLYVWFMNGANRTAGAYASPSQVTDVNWKIEAVADFNGDGKPDLLWRHQTSGWVYVWFMNGTTQVSAGYASPNRVLDLGWKIEGVGDFNGDGKADLLWRHQVTGELYVWLMDGATKTAGVYLTPSRVLDTNWKIEAVEDFNGDGKPDLLWRHQVSGTLYLWLLNGTAQSAGAYPTPNNFGDVNWAVEEAADFNGDGRPDLVWRNRLTGDLQVWYMTGSSRSAAAALVPGRVVDTNWKIESR